MPTTDQIHDVVTPERDTIFALSSGSGKAGVAVFRVSGSQAHKVIETVTRKGPPSPRELLLRQFYSPEGQPIDKGMVVYFPGPKSFSGEDSAELHTHGSLAVIEAMSRAIIAAGARGALPGEFTRRAFENGKMDLTEAEGLADLIDAETEGQRQQAYRQMEGGLREVYESWREGLIDALAAIEGDIDFPDEQDVPDDLSHAAYGPIENVLKDMQKRLEDSGRGESIRRGIRIAIIGHPNAGKSSILNRLAGRDAAIVSDIAGTTRDVIDVHMNLGGLQVILSDTAGIRATDDQIEAEGVSRAMLMAEQADIRLAVITAGRYKDSLQHDLEDVLKETRAGDFVVLNKTDVKYDKRVVDRINFLPISALTGEGFDRLEAELEKAIVTRFGTVENAGLTRARHRNCIETAVTALDRARTSLKAAPELAGDDLRAALHAIKELAGEADIEAVLGAIFSRFCIGK